MASYFKSTQKNNWIYSEHTLEHHKSNRLKEVLRKIHSNHKVKLPSKLLNIITITINNK